MGLKVLACGAGQQSTALALMSAENVLRGKMVYPEVPIYDMTMFCDLGCEPPWVYEQVAFMAWVYERCGMRFDVINVPEILEDHVAKVQNGKYIKMPLWTQDENGKKGKLRRTCTIDYKIIRMQQHVKRELLGYKQTEYKKRNGKTVYRFENIRKEDIGAHEMHIGFSAEENSRIFDSQNDMFKNVFPLHKMGLSRKDNYKYTLEKWGLDTKGSSCIICPYHKNYYYWYLQKYYPAYYNTVLEFDEVLENKPESSPIHSMMFLVPGLKRIRDLTPDECDDAQTFEYCGRQVWNGF